MKSRATIPSSSPVVQFQAKIHYTLHKRYRFAVCCNRGQKDAAKCLSSTSAKSDKWVGGKISESSIDQDRSSYQKVGIFAGTKK